MCYETSELVNTKFFSGSEFNFLLLIRSWIEQNLMNLNAYDNYLKLITSSLCPNSEGSSSLPEQSATKVNGNKLNHFIFKYFLVFCVFKSEILGSSKVCG